MMNSNPEPTCYHCRWLAEWIELEFYGSGLSRRWLEECVMDLEGPADKCPEFEWRDDQ